MSNLVVLVVKTIYKNRSMFQVSFLSTLANTVVFQTKEKVLFVYVLFFYLFLLIKITLKVHFCFIIYGALRNKMTLQNHLIKKYKNSKTISLVTVCTLSLLIPIFLKGIMLSWPPQTC